MSRTRNAMAGLVAAMVIAGCALCATLTAEQSGIEAHNDARIKALKSLQDKVFDLNVAEKKTVKDFIESTDLPKTDLVRSLLQGVAEFKPPRVYGDGECEVRLALSGDALRANLKRILEQSYKKEGGEFAKLTFDGVGGAGLEAVALSTVALPAQSNSTVAECVEGWNRDDSGQRITTLKRIQTEHAAYLDGLAKTQADAEKLTIGDDLTLGALMASKPLVKDAVAKFFATTLPDRKLYWPKGIVEVRFAPDYGALWTALEQANQKSADPQQQVAIAVLATARERTKNQNDTSSGFAQLDGKPVNPADVVQTAAPLDLNAMIEPPVPEPEQAK